MNVNCNDKYHYFPSPANNDMIGHNFSPLYVTFFRALGCTFCASSSITTETVLYAKYIEPLAMIADQNLTISLPVKAMIVEVFRTLSERAT
jgi:hypothetical protein